MMVAALAWCLVLAVTPPLPGPGLYRHTFETGSLDRLGPYHNPSAEAEGGWLYADDGAGRIVRWRLAELGTEPQSFFVTPAGETRRAVPLAGNPAGLVVLTRNDPVRRGAQVLYERVAIEVYNPAGERLAGPLPLVRRAAVRHPSAVAAWQPQGAEPTLAFGLTEGNSRPGLYLFHPLAKHKSWVLAESWQSGAPDPLPELVWQPNGRSLGVLSRGQLELRSGGSYAVYKSFATSASRLFWPDADHFGLADPAAGWEVRDFEGRVTARSDAWRAPSADELSSPAGGPHGLVWVAPAGEQTLALRRLAPGARAADTLITFARGRVPYGQQCSPPVWLPGQEAIVFEIPTPGRGG